MPDERQLGLIAVSAGLALLACAVATALGLPLGLRIATCGGRWRRAAWVTLALTPTLTPSYVYSYVAKLLTAPLTPLDRALAGLGVNPWWQSAVAAGLMQGCWLSGVAALTLAAGATLAMPAVRLALLDAPPAQAWWAVGLRVMRPATAASLAATFALAITDYAIPHLAGVQTWQTELLLNASNNASIAQLTLQSWPTLAAAALLLLALAWASRDPLGMTEELPHVDPALRPGWALTALAAGCVGITVGLPVGGLLLGGDPISPLPAVSRWLSAQGDDLLLSVGLGLAAGATSWGVAVLIPPRWAPAALALWVSLSLVPGAVVGRLLLAHQLAWSASRDVDMALGVGHMVLISVCRSGWVAALLWWHARQTLAPALADLRRLDGAGWRSRVRGELALLWPAALAGSVCTAALSLGEVAATGLVLPPGMPHLGFTLLNEMHYGRRDDIQAASLGLILLAAAAAAALSGLAGTAPGQRFRVRSTSQGTAPLG